jgi:AcrR family transcriptional regulator
MPANSSPPRLDAAARRQLIEQAATELFARNGYASTSVEEIVQHAGVSKPMLYRHFDSKQALCISLLERYRDELAAVPLAEFATAPADSRELMLAMISAWLDHAVRHPAATRLLFTPITGDREVELAQQTLHARQRATQVALLREFAPTALDDAWAEPAGEVFRTSLATVALWSIDHPGASRELLISLLASVADGLIAATNR